ncbi:MAG TPA: VOC family protein [Actinomycetota bacterium]
MAHHAEPVPGLRVDHASIEVPDLGEAVRRLDALGLSVTVTPEAPDRHGRVLLDRSYLEVTVAAAPGDRWIVSSWFLGFDDLPALRAHLDAAGLSYRHEPYEGVDGTWDDVQVDADEVPVPILVRRTAPADVARSWPPALREPHPGGATAISAVHVSVPALEPAVATYARLLDTRPSTVDARRGRVAFRLGDARIVLTERDADLAVVLAVASVERMRERIGPAVGAPRDGVAWVDPAAASGLRLGFAGPAHGSDAGAGRGRIS